MHSTPWGLIHKKDKTFKTALNLQTNQKFELDSLSESFRAVTELTNDFQTEFWIALNSHFFVMWTAHHSEPETIAVIWTLHKYTSENHEIFLAPNVSFSSVCRPDALGNLHHFGFQLYKPENMVLFYCPQSGNGKTQALYSSNFQYLFTHFLEINKYLACPVKSEEIGLWMDIDPHSIYKASSVPVV